MGSVAPDLGSGPIVNLNEESTIDVVAAAEIANSLASVFNQFCANAPLCSSCPDIAILAGAGFDTSSCDAYDSEIQELGSKLVSIASSIQSYVNEVYETDRVIESEIPEEPQEEGEEESSTTETAEVAVPEAVEDVSLESLDDETSDINSGNNQDGTSGETEFNTTEVDNTNIQNISTPVSTPNFDEIVNKCQKYFDNVPVETLHSILTDLCDVAMKYDISIEELLSDDKYAAVILEVLTKNSKIDPDLVKDLKALGEKLTRKTLYSIIAGKISLIGDGKAKEYFKDLCYETAKSKNLNIDELTKNNDKRLKDVVTLIRDSFKYDSSSEASKVANSLLYFDDDKLSYMLSKSIK